MKNTFDLIIAAHNSLIYKGPAVYCGVTTPAGSLGLEAHHEPFLTVLKENSLIHYRTPSAEKKSVAVRNGLLSFKHNTCVMTVSLTA